MKILIDTDTLAHELHCAEQRLDNAKAVLAAAQNHLQYIKDRNAKLATALPQVGARLCGAE